MTTGSDTAAQEQRCLRVATAVRQAPQPDSETERDECGTAPAAGPQDRDGEHLKQDEQSEGPQEQRPHARPPAAWPTGSAPE